MENRVLAISGDAWWLLQTRLSVLLPGDMFRSEHQASGIISPCHTFLSSKGTWNESKPPER